MNLTSGDMPINRQIWQSGIRVDLVPNWPCPKCGAASLSVVENSFNTIPDSKSTLNRNHEDYEAVFETGRFVCLLKCSKAKCEETCAVSGNYGMTEDHDESSYTTYATGYPKSITPPPQMIHIPPACPMKIKKEVKAAFRLYWLDHSSALNRIRNAIELLLTEMGVKRYGEKRGGGRMRLSLGSRLEVLRSKRTDMSNLCERLLAIKHLGNAGSHPGDVHVDDVFDGFDILEHVLTETYTNHASELAKMVKQINQRKGPRKKGL